MKKRDLSKTLAVIGLVVALLVPLFSRNTNASTPDSSLINSLIVTANMYLVISVAFIFAKNDVVKKIGYGFLAIQGIAGLSNIMYGGLTLKTASDVFGLIYTILSLVSVIVWFVKEILEYYGLSANPNSHSSKTELLKPWKKLVDAGKISNEDYVFVKDSVLKNSTSSKIVLELNELRDLIAQGLADSNDFAQLKSSL